MYMLKGTLSMSTSTSTAGVGPTTTATATPTPTGPAVVQSFGSYSYAGCYSDNVGGRALGNEPLTGSTVTPQNCAAACSGYTYVGIEYGGECWW